MDRWQIIPQVFAILAVVCVIFMSINIFRREIRDRLVVHSRLNRLENIATENSLREIDEQPEAVRLNLALAKETILSLYNQTLAAGSVPVSKELEEEAESDASAGLSLGPFTPKYGRKRTATQRTSFAPENEPVRAVIAVEKHLQHSRSIRTIDLTSSIDDRPLSLLLKDIEHRASQMGLELPGGINKDFYSAWESRNRKLADESLASLTGFVKVRADFTLSSNDSGDLLLEAHSNSTSPSSTLSIACRQEDILARTVLVPGETVRATCFGSVTRWDEKRKTLSILPISIYA